MSTLQQAPSAEASTGFTHPFAASVLRSATAQEVERLRQLAGEFQGACDLVLARRQAARPPGDTVPAPATWAELGEMVAVLLEHLGEADAEAARRAGELLFRGFRSYVGSLAQGRRKPGERRPEGEAPAGFDEGRILREAFLAHVTPEEAETLRRVGRFVLPMALDGSAGGTGRVGAKLRAAAEDLRHTARFLGWLVREAGEEPGETGEQIQAVARAADLSGEIRALADKLAALVPAGEATTPAGPGEAR